MDIKLADTVNNSVVKLNPRNEAVLGVLTKRSKAAARKKPYAVCSSPLLIVRTNTVAGENAATSKMKKITRQSENN